MDGKTISIRLGDAIPMPVGYDAALRSSGRLRMPLVSPLSATVNVTMYCNSRCSYCFIWKRREVNSEISQGHLERIFSEIKELGVHSVTLGGGEPLTRPDLDDVVSLARKSGLAVTVLTAGMALTEARAVRLIHAGAECIVLSLDSLNPDVYERQRGVPFRLAHRALLALAASSESVPGFGGAVTCVVTRQNWKDLPEFARGVRDLTGGRVVVHFQPYHSPASKTMAEWWGRDWIALPDVESLDEEMGFDGSLKAPLEEMMERLIDLKNTGVPIDNSVTFLRAMPDFLALGKLPEGWHCYGGYMSLSISPTMDVRSCWRLPLVGNISDRSLVELYYSPGYQRRRDQMYNLDCPGCLLLCSHEESRWHQERRQQEPLEWSP